MVSLSNVQSATEQLSDEPGVVVTASLRGVLEALGSFEHALLLRHLIHREISHFTQRCSEVQHLGEPSCSPAAERRSPGSHWIAHRNSVGESRRGELVTL